MEPKEIVRKPFNFLKYSSYGLSNQCLSSWDISLAFDIYVPLPVALAEE